MTDDDLLAELAALDWRFGNLKEAAKKLGVSLELAVESHQHCADVLIRQHFHRALVQRLAIVTPVIRQ